MADTEAQQESTNAGQSDIDILTEFCHDKEITQQAIEELIRKGYTSLDAFELVDIKDLQSSKILPGQRQLILHVAECLK